MSSGSVATTSTAAGFTSASQSLQSPAAFVQPSPSKSSLGPLMQPMPSAPPVSSGPTSNFGSYPVESPAPGLVSPAPSSSTFVPPPSSSSAAAVESPAVSPSSSPALAVAMPVTVT
jgi:hypothetical protein